jgi:Flp pilus assembly protein TadB
MTVVAPVCLIVFAVLLLTLALRGPRSAVQRSRPRLEGSRDHSSGEPSEGQPFEGQRSEGEPSEGQPSDSSRRPDPSSRLGAPVGRWARGRRFLVARRRREIQADVPEALDILRAAITAGVAPRRALVAASETCPPSLTAVLGEAVRACDLGSGAGEALAEVGSKHELTELTLAGEALDLAERTGAPPGRVLAGVAAAAADRVRGEQARLAATAQARLSARVVAGMAPVFVAVLCLTAPSDAAFLVRGRAGWSTLAASATLEAIGVFWARRIVRGAL